MSEEEINRRIAKAVEVEVEKRLAEHERVRREEREREERERNDKERRDKERRDKEERSRSMNRSLQEERSLGKAIGKTDGEGASGALEDQGVGVGQTSMDDELRQRLSELEQRLYVVDLLFKAVDSGN